MISMEDIRKKIIGSALITIGLTALAITLITVCLFWLFDTKAKPQSEREKFRVDSKLTKIEDLQPQAIEVPKDGMAYIWAMPDRGHQSLVVLNVVDANTVDAAFLVPVRIKMHHMAAPGLEEKGGPEAKAALEKLLMGQMRTAQLWGNSRDGVYADFWIPTQDGKGSWASNLMKEQDRAK